jgi:predicted O-methyltransferase YrrM
MTWEEIDFIIAQSKQTIISPALQARSIASNSRVDPYYSFLQRLALYTKPKGVFLEIGCYYGVTAAYFADAKGWMEHLYLGIDINPVPFSDPGAIFIQDDATKPEVMERVKAVAAAHGGIFAVFQDSSHYYRDSVMEWDLYSPLVRPGGLWIADDLTPAFRRPSEPKGMVDYWNELPGDKRIFDDLHIGSRIGMVRL